MLDTREYHQLNVNQPIYADYVEVWIGKLERWERRDPGCDILVRLNSPGGSVFDGFALFDAILRLRRKGHKVTIHGSGIILSMATILMQAADERVLDKNAWFMIHEVGSNIRGGKSSEIADDLKLLKRLEERALDIYTERSKLSRAQIVRRWKKTDDWMSAEEAVKLGFADRVE